MVTLRELSGANPEFSRVCLRPCPGTTLDTVRDREVYLQFAGSPYEMMSLYPWMDFGVSERFSREVVWFLDKVRKDRIVYTSPQAPSDERVVNEGVDDVRSLIGLE